MKIWRILIYAILVTHVFTLLQTQELTTSTSTTTVQPSPSVTTIISEVEISIGRNSLGLSTTLITTVRIGSPLDTSFPPPPPSNTTSDSPSKGTTSALSSSPTPGSSSLTLPATSVTLTASSFIQLPTGNFTEVHEHENLPISFIGSITVVVYAVFQGCLMGLFAWWWEKREPFLREPEETAAWWIHPIYNFRRLLPRAARHTPRRTEPRVVLVAHLPHQRTKPKISTPIPIHQRPGTPPPRRPRRPLSITESLMEDMRTSPQPRANPDRAEAVHVGDTESTIVTDDVSTDKHCSLSPKPLRILKSNSQSNSGPSGTEIEVRNPIPASARSSSRNYSTLLPGVAPPKPVYLPYRQPDSPPPGRIGQRSLLRSPPTDEQRRVAREDIRERFHQPAPFGDEDEDDEEVKRVRREESLSMLEENSATKTMDTLDEVEEDENTSQGSFDFAEARARKVLADKRMREQFGRSRAAQDLSPPPLPELPVNYRR